MSEISHFTEQVLERTSLAGLVGREVKLTKRGQEFVGLCPFHNEKTPSFHVVEQKGFYHCFGCGANGNALGWVMNRQRLEFIDALKYLADMVGLTLPPMRPKNREEILLDPEND